MNSTIKSGKPRLTSAFQHLMSIHWWMTIAYFVLFISGATMSRMPGEVSFLGLMYDFHKSIGILSMAFLTWRIFILIQVWWKKYSKRFPKLSFKWWQTFALHTALYVFMWAVPISGFLLSNSFKPNNVKFFGLPMPDMFPHDKTMLDVGQQLHFWLSYTFLAFVILHTIAKWKVIRANWRRLVQFLQNATPVSLRTPNDR